VDKLAMFIQKNKELELKKLKMLQKEEEMKIPSLSFAKPEIK
jgi:hypothetical protein